MSGTPHQPFEAQPLLLHKTLAIVAALLNLVSHASGIKSVLKIGCAKQGIPPRQKHTKVVAAHGFGAMALMPDANGMVQAMKAWADPQALAQLAKRIEQPRDVIMQAIGWLAREDKVRIEENGRTRTIALCDPT